MAGSLVPRTNLGGYLAEIGQVYADQRDREEAAKLLGGQLDNLVQQPAAQSMSALGALGQQIGAPAQGPVSSPLPAFARAQGNAPSAKIAGLLADTTAKYNLSPDYLPKLVQIESNGNPNAYNKSGASGLAQFVPSTAKAYGLSDPFDPAANVDAAARLTLDNRRTLTAALGREPTNGELYLGHQQGAGGASKLLANPNARAVDVLGRQAVLQNGGTEEMTAGQFARKWTSKFDGGGAQTAQADMPAPGAREAGYYIPGQQPPAAQQADFAPGSVASPAIGTGAAGSMPDAAGGQPRITPQQAQQLRAMLANPVTAPQAQAVIQKLQAPQEWETKELGGRVVQVNKQGAVRPLPGFEKAPEFQTQKGSDGNDYTFNKATGQWTRAIQGKDTARRDLSVDEKVQRGLDPKAFAQIDSDGQVYFPNKAGTEINLNQAAEKAQDVKIGGAYGDTFNEMQTAGRSASGQLNTFKLMEKLIDRPDFYSGPASGPMLALKRAAASVGVQGADAAAPNELFNKLATQSVLDKLGGSLGAGVSNADVAFMQNTTANAGNTPEGNRQIIQFGKALAQRQIDVSKLARKYAGSHGGRLDAGFDDELAAYAEANPLTPGMTAQQQQQAARPQAPQGGGGQGPSSAQAAPVAPGAPSSPAIDLLRSDPRLRDQFDAKYGRGAADRALGII